MHLNTYQRQTARSDNSSLSRLDKQIMHAMGLAGEAGEVVEMLKKSFYHGHDLSPAALAGELGDVLWYMARLADDFGLDMENIARLNVNKLKRRYPEGFSHDASRNRDD